jgi:hypothetical protein
MVAETRERRLWWRHLISVLIAPVTMTLLIPALILDWPHVHLPDYGSPLNAGLVTVGGLLIAGGLGLLIWTVLLFDREGKGTLGVGKVLGEPVHLVVQGPYRHVRNPMISGVLARRPSRRRVGCCCGLRCSSRALRLSSGSGKNLISLSATAASTSTTGKTSRPGRLESWLGRRAHKS